MGRSTEPGALGSYLQEFSVSVLCVNGDARGSRFKLERERITLGSGPAASISVDTRGVAREHAVIEFWGSSFVLRELDPALPVHLNGNPCHCRELRDGDRFALGDQTFEFHCEKL